MVLQIFVEIDYLLCYIGLKLLQQLQLPNKFIVSVVCNCSLYPSFILNTNLLLLLLMQT